MLREARDDDLPAIDALTSAGYSATQESFVSVLGEDLYETVQADPGQTWEERKAAQNRRLYAEHPEQVWVLDEGGLRLTRSRPGARARAGRHSCTGTLSTASASSARRSTSGSGFTL